MSQRIVIDPITRIEGHLRIEVVVDDENVVREAYSSSTLWRGLETIVKNRDPRDAGFFMQSGHRRGRKRPWYHSAAKCLADAHADG